MRGESVGRRSFGGMMRIGLAEWRGICQSATQLGECGRVFTKKREHLPRTVSRSLASPLQLYSFLCPHPDLDQPGPTRYSNDPIKSPKPL